MELINTVYARKFSPTVSLVEFSAIKLAIDMKEDNFIKVSEVFKFLLECHEIGIDDLIELDHVITEHLKKS